MKNFKTYIAIESSKM